MVNQHHYQCQIYNFPLSNTSKAWSSFLIENFKIVEIVLSSKWILTMQRFKIISYVQKIMYEIPQKRLCSAIAGDSWVLTTEGPRQVYELENISCVLIVDGDRIPIEGFRSIGEKQMVNIVTYRGQLLTCTSDVKLISYNNDTRYDRVPVAVEVLQGRQLDYTKKLLNNTYKIIKRGTRIYIGNNTKYHANPSHQDMCDWGWLVGWVVGDGSYNKQKGTVYYFDSDLHEETQVLAWKAYGIAHRLQATDYKQSRIPKGPCYYNYAKGSHYRVESVKIARLCQDIIKVKSKCIQPQLEKLEFSFHRGFIQGYFAADGTINISKTNFHVSLTSIHMQKLQAVQRILQRNGIMSSIFKSQNENTRVFHQKTYKTQKAYQLNIYSVSMINFSNIFGFGCTRKNHLLQQLLEQKGNKVRRHRQHFTTEFKESVEIGKQNGYKLLGMNRKIEVNGIMIQLDT
eukprot:TRINITY_DN32273_c0_g2_i1.p1 TRINITY_DN32273_c0_g2~~TRINITY_DN32273_c0_g2_i1.p1  ORF type:complete len:488 (+),score=-7.73 TRINITY_DN32273_c0_g2_i1:97-1464(+)